MGNHYQIQLSRTESALRSREKEIERLRSSHAAELDRIAQQLLQFCKEELKEKDRKCEGHIDGLTGQPSQLENMAGKVIPDNKVKVNTPLAKRVLVSSITRLLDILGWCSEREVQCRWNPSDQGETYN